MERSTMILDEKHMKDSNGTDGCIFCQEKRTTLDLMQEIVRLKKEKKAVLLAHYYVEDEIQAIADYVGDSFYLSKIATNLKQDIICFAGVSFMGESVKLLNPDKTVLLPEPNAVCPMAEMAEVQKIEELRSYYDDLAVVCYINSSTELKAYSDVCVTSANALQIVAKLPNKNIYLIPDGHLGSYIASQIPEKNIIINSGFCPLHHRIRKEDVEKAKILHKNAVVLAHPECRSEVLELADVIGSTSQIIEAVMSRKEEEYILCTELGVCYELEKKNVGKHFYSVIAEQICPEMRKISLVKIKRALETLTPCVQVEEKLQKQAMCPLQRMLKLAK